MNMIRKVMVLAVAGCFATGAVGGDDGGDAKKPEVSEKLEKALAGFDRTGEMKRCLNPTRIRNSRVIDDNHIIFEVGASKQYLSTLPRKCHRLGFHRAIKYTVRGGAICKRDLFQVLDNSGIPGPTCNFGEFELLKKKPDTEKQMDSSRD